MLMDWHHSKYADWTSFDTLPEEVFATNSKIIQTEEHTFLLLYLVNICTTTKENKSATVV